MKKSGLQYFSVGQQVEPVDEAAPTAAPAAPDAAPLVYGQAPAGAKPPRYAVPTPKGGVPISPSILEDMERIYQERVAAKDPFGEWIKDVLAWGGTGQAGTTLETLSKRKQAKEDEAAELFRMRSDMAAIRAQQERAKATKQFLQGQIGGRGAGAPAGGGAGMPIPQSLVEEINFLMEDNTEEARKKLSDYTKTYGTERIKRVLGTDYDVKKNDRVIIDPQTGEPRLHTLSNREIDQLESQGIQVMPVGGAAPSPAAARPAPAAPAPATPTMAPKQDGGALVFAKQPQNFTFDELGPKGLAILEEATRNHAEFKPDTVYRESSPDVFNSRPLEVRKRLFADIQNAADTNQPLVAPRKRETFIERVPGETRDPNLVAKGAAAPTPQVAAPAAAPAPARARTLAPGEGPTLSEMKARIEAEKTERTGMAEADVQEYKDFKAATNPNATSQRANVAKEIIDIITKNPSITGVLEKPNAAAAFAKIIETGLSLPGGATIGVAAIDDAVAMAIPGTTQQDLNDRDRLKTLFEATAFSLAAGLKGQGQITEFERRLLQQVAGSIRSTPQNIIKIHKMFFAKAEKDRMLGDLFLSLPPGTKYSDFIRSKDYRRINDNYEKTVEGIRTEKIELGKKLTVPAKPFEDPNEERAYQEWKKRQKGSK